MTLSRRSFLFGAAAACAAGAVKPFFLRDGQRLLSLGDSITQGGQYVEFIEAFLLTRFPERRFDVVKLGLSSETVSGLSERDHPFPRPNVHDRLDGALAKTHPDVVTACYGMNDGIYHPFGADRFAAYQAGIRRLVEKVRQAGATPVLLTPPPFDPLPKRSVVVGADASDFSYKVPYRDYDGVLERYGEWLLTLRKEGLMVIDLHTPLQRYTQAKRRTEAEFTLSKDGIHPGAVGHGLMAAAILEAWHAPAEVEHLRANSAAAGLAARSRIPMPPGLVDALNRYTLTVKSSARASYRIMEGATELGEAKGADLHHGIDLTQFDKLSTNVRAAEVVRLIAERWKVLGPSWLVEVGHKRSHLQKAVPFAEASAQGKEWLEKTRKASRPLTLQLRFV